MRRGTIIVSQLRIATVACSIAVLACNVPSFGQLILPQPGLSAEAQCASSPTFAVQPFSSPGHLFGGVNADCELAVGTCHVLTIRWYQIAMNGWPTAGQPSIFRTGELDVALGIHAYLPSIAVDQAGNATVSFSVSGTSKHMSMWYAVKCASDPQFQSPQELKPGLASFNFTHNGDYSGIDPDPGAPTIFYTHNALPRGSVDPATEWESHAMRIDASCGLDTNGDGLTTGADLIAFTTHWVHLDAEADYRADGNVDMLDLTSFQTDLYGPP